MFFEVLLASKPLFSGLRVMMIFYLEDQLLTLFLHTPLKVLVVRWNVILLKDKIIHLVVKILDSKE
jgi:hypothetical protein